MFRAPIRFVARAGLLAVRAYDREVVVPPVPPLGTLGASSEGSVRNFLEGEGADEVVVGRKGFVGRSWNYKGDVGFWTGNELGKQSVAERGFLTVGIVMLMLKSSGFTEGSQSSS